MPPTHPVYTRVVNVVKKIVDSNQDLEFMREQTWTILVIDSNEVNAFVLPVCVSLFFNLPKKLSIKIFEHHIAKFDRTDNQYLPFAAVTGGTVFAVLG